MFHPPALVPLVLSRFLAEHVKGHLRLLILVAPCWNEAPWLPTFLNMLADLIMDVLVGQVLKGLPYLHLTLWLLSNVCYTDRGSILQSVRQWWGQLKHLCQRSTSSVGRNGQAGVPYSAIFAPKLANFLVHLFQVGLAWHTIGVYHSAISAFWSLIIFTRLLIILSFQN